MIMRMWLPGGVYIDCGGPSLEGTDREQIEQMERTLQAEFQHARRTGITRVLRIYDRRNGGRLNLVPTTSIVRVECIPNDALPPQYTIKDNGRRF
jgi:hypothetical protein